MRNKGDVANNLIDNEKHDHVWANFIAAALVAVNQTVKFDVSADAYFLGHLPMKTALGDYNLENATQADLASTWERPQVEVHVFLLTFYQ